MNSITALLLAGVIGLVAGAILAGLGVGGVGWYLTSDLRELNQSLQQEKAIANAGAARVVQDAARDAEKAQRIADAASLELASAVARAAPKVLESVRYVDREIQVCRAVPDPVRVRNMPAPGGSPGNRENQSAGGSAGTGAPDTDTALYTISADAFEQWRAGILARDERQTLKIRTAGGLIRQARHCSM